MSAFDIVGAVVATPLAAFFVFATVRGFQSGSSSSDDIAAALTFSAMTISWAAFCIARMFGATL